MQISWKTAKQEILNLLAGRSDTLEIPELQLRYLLGWLVQAKLGAAAYEMIGRIIPEIKEPLTADFYTHIYRDTVQKKVFLEVVQKLDPAQTKIVLLKGNAIAPLAWPESYHRYRADVDFMVERPHLQQIHTILQEMGFAYKKPEEIRQYFADLPPTNKEGKIEMVSPRIERVQIEAHTDIFVGHVHRITGNPIEKGIWERLVPAEIEIMPSGAEQEFRFWRLSNEDLILHTMVHTGFNHQFDPNTLRNMIDVLRLNERLDIDWKLIQKRVEEMRSKTAVWLFLHLMEEIFGKLPAPMEDVKRNFSPSWLRRKLIAQVINPELILNLFDILQHKQRYGVLLLIIDRPVDMLRLLFKLSTLLKD